MVIDIQVTQDFIDQRDHRATIYNPGKRSQNQLLKDIEAEILEWHLIKQGIWQDDPRWEIDGHDPILGAVDVKFIHKYYNIDCKKFLYLLKQRGTTNAYVFAEWINRPTGLLQAGQEIQVNTIGWLAYEEAISKVQVSGYNGYYIDVRKATEQMGTKFGGPFHDGLVE